MSDKSMTAGEVWRVLPKRCRKGDDRRGGIVIEILNLGAGVQSSTLLLMSIHGELPRLDHAIFADTQWESAATYRWLDWLTERATAVGVSVHRVTKGDIRHDHLTGMLSGHNGKTHVREGIEGKGQRWGSMPFFVLNDNGSQGIIRRQCTKEYKIEPIRKFIKREILGLQPNDRWPKEPVVRKWYGISWDERQRELTVDSDGAWAVNWHPLIEQRITRGMCIEWMLRHGYPEPPRSACLACPYRSQLEWRTLQRSSPGEFSQAVEFDKAMRKCGGMGGDVFVHRKMKPLDEVDLKTDIEKGQGVLFDADGDFRDECSGMCGV